MSYKHGIAALNLEMTDLVPRTEYSVTGHYDLIKKFTGIDGTLPGKSVEACIALMKEWDFSINWNILISNQVFGEWQTSMGHAEYAHGGSDRNDNIYCPFKNEEDIFSDREVFRALFGQYLRGFVFLEKKIKQFHR